MKKYKLILFVLLWISPLYVQKTFAFVRGVDRYEISAGGDFPVYTGLQLRYNWSVNYYTKVSSGFALTWFMDIQQNLLDGLGFAPRNRVLTSALVNSLVLSANMGWAMSIYEGPFIEAGYKLLNWGRGEIRGRDIQQHLSSTLNIGGDSINHINMLTHGPQLNIGYRFVLADKLSLSLDLGVHKPLFAKVDLNYVNVSVPAGSADRIKEIVFEDLWFFSTGIWLGVSF